METLGCGSVMDGASDPAMEGSKVHYPTNLKNHVEEE